MSDYKELCASLREEAEAVQAIEWEIPICTDNHIREAADVIEHLSAEVDRLTKERDQWKMLGELANKRAEDYREMRRQRDNAAECNARLIADVARLEAESRAKEQYIAEHMGGTAERNARMKRDAERLRGTTAHANPDSDILLEDEYK